jgi:hypothetical protein
VGATLFTVGQVSGWEGFEIAGTRVLDELAAHLEAERANEPPPEAQRVLDEPGEPPTPPGPEAGDPPHTLFLPLVGPGKD